MFYGSDFGKCYPRVNSAIANYWSGSSLLHRCRPCSGSMGMGFYFFLHKLPKPSLIHSSITCFQSFSCSLCYRPWKSTHCSSHSFVYLIFCRKRSNLSSHPLFLYYTLIARLLISLPSRSRWKLESSWTQLLKGITPVLNLISLTFSFNIFFFH